MCLQGLRLVLHDAIKKGSMTVGLELSLLWRLSIFFAEAVRKCKEKRVVRGKGDELVQVVGRVGLNLVRPGEIERCRIAD